MFELLYKFIQANIKIRKAKHWPNTTAETYRQNNKSEVQSLSYRGFAPFCPVPLRHLEIWCIDDAPMSYRSGLQMPQTTPQLEPEHRLPQ